METQVMEISLDSTCVYRCKGCSLGEKGGEKITNFPGEVINMADAVYNAFPDQPFSLEINTPLTSYKHLSLPKKLFSGAKEVNLSLGIIDGNDEHDCSLIQQIGQIPRVLQEVKKKFFDRMGFSFGAAISDIENIVTISYLIALEIARQKAEGKLFFSNQFDVAYSENNVPDKALAQERFEYVRRNSKQYLKDVFADGFGEIAGGIALAQSNIGLPIDTSYATGGGHGIGFHALYQRRSQREPKRVDLTIDHRFLHLPQGFGKHVEPELIEGSIAEGLANIMITPSKIHLLHSSTNMRMSDRLSMSHDDFQARMNENAMPYTDFIHSLVR